MCNVAGKKTTASASLVTLEQSILPGFIPPKPLDRLIKGKLHMIGAGLLSSSVLLMLVEHLLRVVLLVNRISLHAGIASKQIQRIMGDLRGEVANIKAGAPRAWLWQRLRLHLLRVICAWLSGVRHVCTWLPDN